MFANLNSTHLFCPKCGSSSYTKSVVKELLNQVKRKQNFEHKNMYFVHCEKCGIRYFKCFSVEKYKLIYFFREE